MENESLAKLCHAWQILKDEENAARNGRVELEKQIYLQANVKENGTAKTQAGAYAITITTNTTLKLDEAAWQQVADQVPADLSPVRQKLSVDKRALNDLKKFKPELFNAISVAITSTPSKPTFKIEVNND